MNVFTVRSRIFICAAPGYGSEERAFLSNHSLVQVNLRFNQEECQLLAWEYGLQMVVNLIENVIGVGFIQMIGSKKVNMLKA